MEFNNKIKMMKRKKHSNIQGQKFMLLFWEAIC